MAFISEFNSLMWGYVLSIILLGTGLVYSIATGFPQLTQFGKIWDSLKANMNGEGGISGFSALCATVGGQVGTGSLVGVASALLAGGPGALFWMWITALFGMVISFAEAVLGQLYHEKSPDGNFYGGAPYYMTKGLHNKTLACLYAAFTVFTMEIAIVMLQTHSIASAVTVIYPLPIWVLGIGVALLTALVVLGGVKRITETASLVVPFMAVIYLLGVIYIVITHFAQIPALFAQIMSSAFTTEAAAGGAVGYTIKEAVRNGVARGLFSNDAGNGCAAAMHASAKVEHPAMQGFAAMFGTFMTTIVICSCTGFAILLSGVLHSGAIGVNLVQAAFSANLGSFGNYFVMLMTFLFCFTTIIADVFYGEVSVRYLFKETPEKVERYVKMFKILVLLLIIVGSMMQLDDLWDFVDFGVAFLVLFNVYALLKMKGDVVHVLKDYLEKLKEGKIPSWEAEGSQPR